MRNCTFFLQKVILKEQPVDWISDISFNEDYLRSDDFSYKH